MPKATNVLWTILVAAVLIPLIFPLKLPLGPSPEGEAAYAFVESLPEGSLAMMVVEIAPSNEGELWPMALAVARHHLQKGHKLLLVTFVPDGVMYSEKIREMAVGEFGCQYGSDLLVLPYRAGGENALSAMADDICKAYDRDQYGSSLSGSSLWSCVRSIKDISVVSCYTSGDDHLWLARHVWAKHRVPCISGNIALSTPEAMVYYKNGQLAGLVSGVKGAAFYEQKVGKPGLATQSMDAQSVGHLYLLLLMVGGNVSFWLGRKNEKTAKGGLVK